MSDTKFKVGDNVKVSRRQSGEYALWVPSMDSVLGTTQEVVVVDEYRHSYRLKGSAFWFPEEALDPAQKVNFFADIHTGDYVKFKDGQLCYAMVSPVAPRVNFFPVVQNTDGKYLIKLDSFSAPTIMSITDEVSVRGEYVTATVEYIMRPRVPSLTMSIENLDYTCDKVYEDVKVKEYTIAQLEKKLGCKIKIVKEESNNG